MHLTVALARALALGVVEPKAKHAYRVVGVMEALKTNLGEELEIVRAYSWNFLAAIPPHCAAVRRKRRYAGARPPHRTTFRSAVKIAPRAGTDSDQLQARLPGRDYLVVRLKRDVRRYGVARSASHAHSPRHPRIPSCLVPWAHKHGTSLKSEIAS
eukprot:SAG11_NODE_1964_length_3990_cov_2.228733_4_plen_156_part_00